VTHKVSQSCIVLAGGLGTRLRSAVGVRPKCLAPVGRRAFIEIEIEALLASGIDDVVLSLGYGAGTVVGALASTLAARRVRYVIEPSPLGTGGAIAHVMDTLGLDEVLAANGDTYLSGDIGGMLTPLRSGQGELFRMAVVRVPERSRFGGIQVGADGRVEAFIDKGRQGPGEINAGLYRLCRQAMPAARNGAYSLETDVLPALVAQGLVTALAVHGSFTDIGVPEDYFRFCKQHGG
jgi:D-glycero-alpha-D-manno-heptose 1-phosphate guanylyltransferase